MENLDNRKMRLIEFIVAENEPTALKQIEDLIHKISYDEASRSKVIGLRPNGVRVIKSEFVECIQRTLIDVSNGEFITLEELDKRSGTW